MNSSPSHHPIRLTLGAVLLLASTLSAWATDDIYKQFGLDLGYAGRTHRWSIYTYGAGTAKSPLTTLDISANGPTTDQVRGDVALAGAYSNLTISGYGSITGDRYEQPTSTETTSGHVLLTGSRYRDSATGSKLSAGVTSLENASMKAAALRATDSRQNIVLSASNLTLNSTGKYVMNLTDLVLSKGATLTLNGTSGSAFVINVSNNFNLGGASKIVLRGSLTPSDVLFNVIGNNEGAKGALPFAVTGGSQFSGTLLSYNSASKGKQRGFEISGSSDFDGQLIANAAKISGQAKVRKRPKGSE